MMLKTHIYNWNCDKMQLIFGKNDLDSNPHPSRQEKNPEKRHWKLWDLNPGPLDLKAKMLPLSYQDSFRNVYYYCIYYLRLGAQSVTLLSTLRDLTQLRGRQWATRQRHPFFVAHQKEGIYRPKKFHNSQKKFFAVDHPLCDVWKQKTQILIAHQKERIDRTKKGRLAAKKSLARVHSNQEIGVICTLFWPDADLNSRRSSES